MALTPGADKLNRFLAKAREASRAGGPLEIAIGNEAADLDSMASAVLWAYARSARPGEGDAAPVAVINIPRADFKLRTEAVYLFEAAGVDISQLVFADEIDLRALHGAGRLQLALVDHNKLAPSQADLADTVTAVIDHHQDEGLFESAAPRIIEPVGSAATLVAEQLLAHGEVLLDEGAATLLLGTILLDTVNLDPAAKRVTPKDEAVANRLLALTGADRQALFDALQREKFNVSALDTTDLLRKDYKQWMLGGVKVGIASVLLPVADWLEKDSALPASLDDFARARGLDVLLAMNAFTAPEFTRELVVHCPADGLRERLLQFLAGAGLELEAIEGPGGPVTRYYAQGNLGCSRKKLQPLLNDFFSAADAASQA